jgi:hypothetical protein
LPVLLEVGRHGSRLCGSGSVPLATETTRETVESEELPEVGDERTPSHRRCFPNEERRRKKGQEHGVLVDLPLHVLFRDSIKRRLE